MTTAREITVTVEELEALFRRVVREEIGERTRPVDEPKPTRVRRDPSPQAYADVMARRRRRGR